MPSLFEITEDMLNINAALDEVDDPEGRRILVDAKLRTEEDLGEKLDNYAALIKELEARAGARAEEADRLKTLASSDIARAKLLSDRLLAYMQECGHTRVDTRRYRLSQVTNGGSAPLQIDIPDQEIPEAFTRIQRVTDRTAIRQALEEGADLPWARIGERQKRLQIK